MPISTKKYSSNIESFDIGLQTYWNLDWRINFPTGISLFSRDLVAYNYFDGRP